MTGYGNAKLGLEGDPRLEAAHRQHKKDLGIEKNLTPPPPGYRPSHGPLAEKHGFGARVPFDSYIHWATITRAIQEEGAIDDPEGHIRAGVADRATYVASLSLRSATWINVFFLITTDILGPSNAPWAISQVGYGAGVLLYFFMGAIAAYTGWQIWRMFLGLDSFRYPLTTYTELSNRVYGKYVKVGVNVLQSVQLLFNVAVIVLGNGQGLTQIAQNKVCFSVLVLIWALAGMVLAQIRSLHRFTWIANFAIWMNLFVIFATMGVIAQTGVNNEAAQQQNGVTPGTPISHVAFASGPFGPQIVGIMQMVYAYGGAMIFVEMMAEMKRPWDFWKGMVCAELLIFSCYMLYGVFVYSQQGQYTVNPANQGIPNQYYGWQTALNSISLVSALIAAGLYGNVGLKIVYQTFVVEIANGPTLATKKGKFLWPFAVVFYWGLAFVVGSSIPQINNISGVVAAACILQFTYTFPPILKLGYDIQWDALQGDGEFDEATGYRQRVDTWRDWSRWARGIRPQWYVKLFNLLIFLSACVLCGLGMYSSIEGIISGFAQSGAASSFGCTPPI